jgi:diaminohydroxyphosphoribosylaminopyrimidine deaminase/5-amino-6-(5-phosphoribosylamino)uracil reductase
VGEGWHAGAGTPHAEVVALQAAGPRARGGTAVVTLEPCDHTGRTGPCSVALLEAGVARVVVAQADTSGTARGGAARLAAAGVAVEQGLLADEAAALNPEWSFSLAAGRPFVTWKVASSLDGRVAAADGSSRWITSPQARAEVHRGRARCDAVLVGAGTVRADDPQLTVRDGHERPAAQQPLRAVMGLSDLPAQARVLDDAAPTVHLRTHDPREALHRLHAGGCHHVWLEGGPTVAGAFVAAGLVDRVVTYLAPVLLGDGVPALGPAGVPTLTAAPRLQVVDMAQVGPDVRVVAERKET